MSDQDVAAALRRKLQLEANRRNNAYDRYGMDNTPESVDPVAYAAVVALEQRFAVTPEMVTRFRRVCGHDVCDGYGLRPESVRLALEQALAIGGGDE